MNKSKLLLTAILALCVGAFIEATCYIAGRFLTRRGLFYESQSTQNFHEYEARRHPVLGWPSPQAFGSGAFDADGARTLPAFPEPGGACVSLYGDSFTFGAGVSNEHAWSNVLAKRLGCRVANYGTGAYGSDQAVLRFEYRTDDEADTVVLGHLSENILRNVNQLRGTLYAGSEYGLKPRFVLAGEDGLRLIPLPKPQAEKFAELVAWPERFDHEFFAPGGKSGKSRLRLPYALSLLRSLRHFHVRAVLARRPWYAEFYDRDHPSQGLEITTRIVERFYRLAAERGKRSVAILIPTGLDLQFYRRTGSWTYAPLVERLQRRRLPILDLGPSFAEAIGDGDPCAIFRPCNGHFNERGYELLAGLVANYLRAEGLP